MSEEQRVRIRIHYQGVPHWLCRVEPDAAIRLTQNPTHAILLARDAARAQARSLRANDPNTPIEIVCFNGVTLDEVEEPVEFAPDNRLPVYDDVSGVRIVPGAAGAWYIRFPNSPYESIRGITAEETLKKYNEHPQHLELSRWVERYVPPVEPPVDPREIQRQFEREQMNGRRLRIGDRS
jgi:hypothetical protein